jgi:hypothetical protein
MSVCPGELEQNAIFVGAFRKGGESYSQVAIFTIAYADALVRENLGMPVVSRGNVNDEASGHNRALLSS